ncbi:MAG: glycosyltransferase [Hyphomicrobiales bacterium]|nr:glycosyltransferase [Hyphomicrobiales bacterium]
MRAQADRVLPGPIAYLTGEYPRATDTFIQREVVALRRQGFEVLTCSVRKTGSEHHVGPEQREEARGTFYILSRARSPLRLARDHLKAFAASPSRYFSALKLAVRTSPPGLKALTYQLFYFLEAVVLAEHLKREGVVHLHNHIATASCTVAMLASEISGVPYSFTIHGPGIFFEPMHWRIDEKTARASFVSCISDFCRSQVMMFSDRRHWDKLHIVHCGVEPERYDGARNTSGHRLLFVGRLAGVKGISVLFQALEQVVRRFPGLHLTLIGDGPEREDLEREAGARGLAGAVSFAGYRSQAEVAKALRETDMLVLPSFAEGVPVVLMEAMAAGLPIISSRVAGIPELVEDGVSGLLVPPGDADAVASAISELLADPALRVSMGERGRAKVVSEFNLKYEAAWLGELFQAYIFGLPNPGKQPLREHCARADRVQCRIDR